MNNTRLRSRIRSGLSIASALIFASALFVGFLTVESAQTPPTGRSVTPAPDSGAIDRPTSEPYTGDLSIFEAEDRAEKLQIDRVMDILKIGQGSRVVDLGAGSGWFTVRAARRAGREGIVYAVEINSDYIKHIDARARAEKLSNIRTVLGTEDDPRLAGATVDAILILKTYHEIADPISILRHLRAVMRPGARLGIIDRNGKGDDHGVDSQVVVDEARRAGFVLVEQYDFVKGDEMDYFLVFEPG